MIFIQPFIRPAMNRQVNEFTVEVFGDPCLLLLPCVGRWKLMRQDGGHNSTLEDFEKGGRLFRRLTMATFYLLPLIATYCHLLPLIGTAVVASRWSASKVLIDVRVTLPQFSSISELPKATLISPIRLGTSSMFWQSSPKKSEDSGWTTVWT